MTNSRFDGNPSFHPALHALCSSATLSLINMDLDIALVTVAAIAHVHKGMFRFFSDPFYLLERI
jgi:hypothetical protein